jgi:regulator of sigma E protease
MTILLFFIILALLILVHEAGHFCVAKLFRIRVDEFGLGFPPRLLSWKKGETRYSLNLIPFGGFVKIFGEDPTEPVPESEGERNFARKSRSVQAAVLVAGIVGNMFLAWVLLSLGFMTGLPAPQGAFADVPLQNPQLTVLEVVPNSPAAAAGVRAGDTITALTRDNETREHPNADMASAFIARSEKAIQITLRQNGEEKIISVVPTQGIVEGKPAIGIAMETVGTVRLPLHRAFWEGGKTTIVLTGETARALAEFVRSAFTGDADIKSLTGPVGIAGLVGDARSEGAAALLLLTALISINLALINLVPFPALDGGRLLFVGIEAIGRKPLPPRIAHTANAVGFLILLLLLALVTANDLSRFW